MRSPHTEARVELKSILFLTDFSQPSEVATPFAVAIAREFGAKVHAVHVVIPDPYLYMSPETAGVAAQSQDEDAEAEMERVQARLSGVPNELSIVHSGRLWPAVEKEIVERAADLVVLGTHGRTGAEKLLLGSCAEEILRRSRIPVMTIGPMVRSYFHNGARFHRVLFATDFGPGSRAALPYAISFAQETQARLILLHVLRMRAPGAEYRLDEPTVAGAMYDLHELVPQNAELWCRPETVVEYGEPGDQILHVAAERSVDLIVLGVRSPGGEPGGAIHLGNRTAYKVLSHAKCPVLTVRE